MFDVDVLDTDDEELSVVRRVYRRELPARIAALDLGSNSFHLVVAEVRGHEFEIVARSKERVQLGASVFGTGRIDDEAFTRGLSAVRRLREIAAEWVPQTSIAVATSAMREAANGREFARAAQDLIQAANTTPGIVNTFTTFSTGTPQIIGVVSVQEGTELLAEAGMQRLRSKSTALTSYLIHLFDEWLAPLGFQLATPRADARRGGHVTLAHPHAKQINAALIASGIIGDYRAPDRIRLAPVPITTSFTDVWDALDRLRTIIADGSYANSTPEFSRVT